MWDGGRGARGTYSKDIRARLLLTVFALLCHNVHLEVHDVVGSLGLGIGLIVLIYKQHLLLEHEEHLLPPVLGCRDVHLQEPLLVALNLRLDTEQSVTFEG